MADRIRARCRFCRLDFYSPSWPAPRRAAAPAAGVAFAANKKLSEARARH